MQYFVLVGLHKCLQVKHLRAFAVILALVVAVSGMAIAQDAVKDGKEKRGGFIKENPTIRAQAVKFGTSKKGIKTPSEEIQPVKILDEKVGGTTDEVVVTSPPYVPPPPPPITIGGTAGSGYFGYGNTSDPGAYGGTGSGTGETPAEPARDFYKHCSSQWAVTETWYADSVIAPCNKPGVFSTVSFICKYTGKITSNESESIVTPKICGEGVITNWGVDVYGRVQDACGGAYQFNHYDYAYTKYGNGESSLRTQFPNFQRGN